MLDPADKIVISDGLGIKTHERRSQAILPLPQSRSRTIYPPRSHFGIMGLVRRMKRPVFIDFGPATPRARIRHPESSASAQIFGVVRYPRNFGSFYAPSEQPTILSK
ncbi:hypothetical protein [uncultured Ruegeria sp.]|uniref:hypothetical protein n=1 Tax=uncultured Ruegeria sp. TaxID=259304 RepID=UPI002609A90B|nr:hypothetical protein [uncultured Ruegeria sp.]